MPNPDDSTVPASTVPASAVPASAVPASTVPASTVPVSPVSPACPCLSGESYDACCGRLHRGEARAVTAAQLMRSRYAAFAVGDVAYLLRSWHPDTRPDVLELDPTVRWLRLDLERSAGGGVLENTGTVEFTAYFRQDGVRGSQHELSRFEKVSGAWLYVDAV